MLGKTSSGIEWKLDLSDATQHWIVYGAYEGARTMMWMRALFENGVVAIESGANIGQTLLYYINCSDTRILAIDPLPKAISWLSECIDHNKFSNIELINEELAEGGIQTKGQKNRGTKKRRRTEKSIKNTQTNKGEQKWPKLST